MKSVRTTNDVAIRGIELISDYATILITDKKVEPVASARSRTELQA